MTISQKSRKKKVVPYIMLSTVPIILEKEELYTKIHQPDKDIVDTNYGLL